MSKEDYNLNLEYRDRINSEIKELVQSFLSEKRGVIDLSRKLSGYHSTVVHTHSKTPDYKSELSVALSTFIGIDSETDALPMGELRKMWHPSTAAIEDEKIRQAEDKYRDEARIACKTILNLLK